MTIARARRDSVEIAYELCGADDGEPLLLVMGLGMQMLGWPDDFCSELAERGFAPVRFDNRDVGLTTHLSAAGAPSLGRILVRSGVAAAYRLEEMADDAVAVLDELGWASAHVVGLSLGGMIAQTLAVRHPARVRTLTSMMSTPSPWIGRARIKALLTLPPRGVHDREEAGQRLVTVFRVIGSPRYPMDEEQMREVGRRSYDRSHDPGGTSRQLAAIMASGDRRPGLSAVRVPTLVLHGEADPMIRRAGGRATANAVPAARLVTYPGMGHDLPRPLWPAFIDEISHLRDRRR